MELKQPYYTKLLKFCRLLIVPYGIETSFWCELRKWWSLLIVPYGIET